MCALSSLRADLDSAEFEGVVLRQWFLLLRGDEVGEGGTGVEAVGERARGSGLR